MTDIRKLITARLQDFDPTLDIAEGSPVDSIVISPILEVLSNNVLELDVNDFIKTKLVEAFPDITFGTGDALTDVLVNAPSVLIEPYRAEMQRIASAQSLANVANMADDDVDALASNWLVNRITGSRARVTVTIKMVVPRQLSINLSVRFVTRTGLIFKPTSQYTVTANQVLTYQVADGSYEIPVQCIAEAAGSEYNVGIGDIVAVSNLDNVTSVTNTSPAYGGIDRENNQSLVNRISQVVSERSLVTDRGIRAKILAEEVNVRSVTVIGYGDPEMQRDTISVNNYGKIKGSGFFYSYGPFGVLALYTGTPLAGDELTCKELDEDRHYAFTIDAVEAVGNLGDLLTGAQAYYVKGAFYGTYGVNSVVLSEKTSLITDTAPPSTNIGGKIDVYVTPNNDIESSFDVSNRYTGGTEGTGVQFQTTLEGHKSVIRLFVNGTTVSSNAPFSGEDGHKFLIISSGRYQGAYKVLDTVLEVNTGALSKVGVIVDADLSSLGPSIDLEARWRGCDSLDIELNAPTYQIAPYGPGELSVSIGSDRRSFSTQYDVLRYVQEGDLLNIPQLNVTLPITRVEEGKLFTDSRVSAQGVYQATIDRSTSSISDIITHVNSVQLSNGTSLSYGKCLGAEVVSPSEPKLLSDGGLCVALPSFYDLFKQDDRRLSLSASDGGYTIQVADTDDNTYLNWTNPSADMRYDSFIVRVVFNLAANPSDTADAFEVMLPNNMLAKEYCIVSCYGDLDVDALIEAVESVYAQNGSISDLAGMINISTKQPLEAPSGSIISYGNATHLVDDVFKVRININSPVDEQGVRSVSSNVIKIDLVRTKDSIEPPTSSGAQRSFRFNSSSLGSLPAIDFLDFIKMLCRPAKLRYSGLLWQNATGQFSLNGLPTNDSDYNISNLIDEEYVVSSYSPIRSTLNLYYSSPSSLSLRLPYRRHLSHVGIGSLFEEVADKYSPSDIVRAGDAVLDPSYASYVKAGLSWSRNASFSNNIAEFSQIACADSFLEEAHDYRGDYLVTSGIPASELIDTDEITHIDFLKESFRVRGSVPEIVKYRLYIVEDEENGVTVSSILENNAYENWIALYDDNTTRLTEGFDKLRNMYGSSIRDLLNSLDPSTRVANSFSSPSESSVYAFYLLDDSDDDQSGLPTFTAVSGSNELSLNKLYVNDVPSVPLNIKGDYIWVDQADGTDARYSITGTDASSIIIDKPLQFTTGQLGNYGWCYINAAEPNKIIIEGPSVTYIDDEGNTVSTTPLVGDNASGINCGGTSGFLSTLDAGKTFTLVNSVFNPKSYLSLVDESGDTLEALYPTIAQDLDSIRVFSQHLGSFSISSVQSFSEYDIYLDANVVYRQEITLSGLPNLDLLGKVRDVFDYVPSFFRVSEDRISVEESVLKTCVSAQVYHREPYTYKVAKIPMDYGVLDQKIQLSTLSDTHPGEGTDAIFETATLGGVVYYSRDMSRTPYMIYRPDTLIMNTEPYYGGIHKVSVDSVFLSTLGVENGTSVQVSGADTIGYQTKGNGLTFSTEETVILSMPPVIYDNGNRVDVTEQDISILYESSPVIAALEDKYNSPRHRSVCSDILIRRSSPCYVGVYLRYTGGSSSDIVRNDIQTLINNSALSGFDVSVSDITALAHRRGAKFITESAIYMVMLDQDRVRRVFIARTTINSALQSTYSGTTRTTGIEIPTSLKLGVVIDVEKN